jgi:hypothetical protein
MPVRLFCVRVILYVSSGLATEKSLPNVYRLWNRISGEGPEGK